MYVGRPLWPGTGLWKRIEAPPDGHDLARDVVSRQWRTHPTDDAPPLRRPILEKYFLALFAAVVVPLLINGVSEAWFGYQDQRAMLDARLAGRGIGRGGADPGVSRRHTKRDAMGRPTALDQYQRGGSPHRCAAAAPPGAGDRRARPDRRRRDRASDGLADPARCDRAGHRSLDRPCRDWRASGAQLVRTGHAEPRLRAIYDARGRRQPAVRRRRRRADQSEADLGCHFRHPNREVRDGIRDRRQRPAGRTSRHRPGAAGRQ